MHNFASVVGHSQVCHFDLYIIIDTFHMHPSTIPLILQILYQLHCRCVSTASSSKNFALSPNMPISEVRCTVTASVQNFHEFAAFGVFRLSMHPDCIAILTQVFHPNFRISHCRCIPTASLSWCQ